MEDKTSGKRIALLSPCGWGNLGDAAIMDSIIRGFESRSPSIQFIGITLNPADTQTRHGIHAITVCGYSKSNYSVNLKSEKVGNEARRSESHSAKSRSTVHNQIEPSQQSSRIRQVLKTVPFLVTLVQATRKKLINLRLFVSEARHVRSSFRVLRDVDAVIVAGGGQVDDLWGGAYGHPYILFRWALLAKMRKTPFIMMSVGVGEIGSRSSRFFFRHALALARYRSYRDEGSRRLLSFFSPATSDPVVPDLAFGLPWRGAQRPTTDREIGISPISFKKPGSWPDSNATFFETYLAAMKAMICDMVALGFRIRLLASTISDMKVIDQLTATFDRNLMKSVSICSVETEDEFLTACSAVSLVVASRMHGLLLSALAGCPVIALSFDRKVDQLMSDLGLEDSCFSIREFEPDEIAALVEYKHLNRQEIIEEISKKVSKAAADVDSQFDTVADLLAIRRSGDVR